MDANERHNNEYRTSYVSGNTVRKLNAAPDIRREEEQYQVIAPRKQVQRRPKSQPGMDLLFLFVLSLAILATVYVFVQYLREQSDILQSEKNIIAMEHTLTSLSDQNNAAYEQISKEYNLQYIYDMAVGELGMVYPNKNKIVKYKSSDADYVIQYSDIPEATKETLLDKILQ